MDTKVEELQKPQSDIALNENNNRELAFDINSKELGEAIQGEKHVETIDCDETNIVGSPSKPLQNENKTVYEDMNVENLDEPSTSTGVTRSSTSKHEMKSKPAILKRKRKISEEPEIENFLKRMTEDIDEILEKTAEKNKLSARNVKSIIRHVITNEHVLSMVRNTMNSENEDDSEVVEAFYEPKLTRSKLRQLTKQPKETNAAAIIADKTETGKLLVHEFPENESSDDDDFEPVAENENEEESDEDDLNLSANLSDVGSPGDDEINAIPENTEQESTSLQSEDEARLVIEEPEKPEMFDEIPFDSTDFQDDEDTISLRTRSKLPLDNTPLESIEAAFIAPDITVDMYDSYCDNDDWRSFLKDFMKPITNTEEAEDDANDPEYDFLEDDDEMTDQWDLRNDRAVQVSKRELNELISELLEATQQQDCDDEDDLNDTFDATMPHLDIPQIQPENEPQNQSVSPFLTADMVAILEEQMRMHVQLLTQTYILTQGDTELVAYSQSAKTLLNELASFAKKEFPYPNRKSAFAAHNLPEALRIIEKIESNQASSNNAALKKGPQVERAYGRRKIPKEIQETFAGSRVFIYPELLPHCMMEPKNISSKPLYILSEDTLVAYGLEEFSWVKNIEKYRLIHTHMLPVKTEVGIRKRVQNRKHRSALNQSWQQNPIAYYFKYGRAMREPIDVPNFTTDQALAPCERHFAPKVMPEWVHPYCRPKKLPLVPSVQTSPEPIVLETEQSLDSTSLKDTPSVTENLQEIEDTSLISTSELISNENEPAPYKARIGKDSKRQSPKKLKPILPLAKSPGKLRTSPMKLRPILPLIRSPNKLRTSPMKHAAVILKKYGLRSGYIAIRGGGPGFTSPTKIMDKYKKLLPKPLQQDPKTTTEVKSRPVKKVRLNFDVIENTGQEVEGSGVESKTNDVGDDVVVSPEPVPITEEGIAGDAGSQSEVDTCEEEDEAIDNEVDLAALMEASSTIFRKKKAIKIQTKKKKHERELESTLPLLANDLVINDPQREARLTAFANNYFQRVKDALVDDIETFEAFGMALVNSKSKNTDPVELYHEICKIFRNYPKLVDEFVQFLPPEAAKDCGRYEDYVLFEKSLLFLRKLEVQFGNQPNQLQKLLKVFHHLQKQVDLSSEVIHSSLNPFLRSRNHILEELNLLMPDERPPESLMTDFEEFQLPDSDTELDEIRVNDDLSDFEDFVVPETEDPYGTNKCPCNCHNNSSDLRMKNRNRHCVSCGLRFIDGKIFLQKGKVLKPAQVIYHSKVKLADFNNEASAKSAASGKPEVTTVSNVKDVLEERDVTVVPTVGTHSESLMAFDAVQVNAIGKPEVTTAPNVKDVLSSAMEENDLSEVVPTHSEPLPPSDAVQEVPCPKWSRVEDALLLKTCQKLHASNEELELAFEQVCQSLENRSLESIKNRFKELLSLFLADKSDDELETDEDSIDNL